MNVVPQTDMKTPRPARSYIQEDFRERAPGAALNAVLFGLLCVGILAAVVLSMPWMRAALGLYQPPESLPALARTGVRVTEIMTSNRTTLTDETGAFPDWVEITNTGNAAEELAGYSLSDDQKRVRFMFPPCRLEPGAIMIIFASGKTRTDSQPFHANMKLSSLGETLYFSNPAGELIEQIDIPALGADISFARGASGWSRASEPSPGFPNTPQGRAAFVASMSVEGAKLQLNELMASNKTTLFDITNRAPDWIELYNNGPEPVELSSFALTDDPKKPVKWRFPQGVTVGPYETYVVYCSGYSAVLGGFAHTSFKLAANHGYVALTSITGRVVDSTEYDNLKPDMVWYRKANGGEWAKSMDPTPGAANNYTPSR